MNLFVVMTLVSMAMVMCASEKQLVNEPADQMPKILFFGATADHLPEYYDFNAQEFKSPELKQAFRRVCLQYTRIYCCGNYATQLQKMCTQARYFETENFTTFAVAYKALKGKNSIEDTQIISEFEEFVDDPRDIAMLKALVARR